MSWESIDWRPADSESLGAGAAIMPLWSMIRSAIAESVSADAMCPVTVGELGVAHLDATELPESLETARSFELLGTDRRGSWALLDPAKGQKLGGKEYSASRLQDLALEGLDGTFEALLGEGLNLGDPLAEAAPEGEALLLRLPLRSADAEEAALVSVYGARVAGELAAHVNALQTLAAETPETAPATPAAPSPLKTPTVPRPTPGSFGVTPARSDVAVPPAALASAGYDAGFGAQAFGGAGYGNGGFGPGAGAYGPGNGGYGTAGGLPPMPSNVRPAQLPELAGGPGGGAPHNIDLLLGVNLQVSVEIGRTQLPIRDVLALTPGSIVELDKLAGEKVDVLVNGRSIAQGEVVVVDENFGVRITDVVARQARLQPGDARA